MVLPGEFCAKRASWMTASLGWTVVVWAGAGGGVGSGSMGTGEPSLDRLSGVWTPLEWADSAPVWLGEAGALLEHNIFFFLGRFTHAVPLHTQILTLKTPL